MKHTCLTPPFEQWAIHCAHAGSERVCARVGKGGLEQVLVPQGAQQATDLFDSCNLAVGLRIDNAPNQCLSGSGPLATALPHRPAGIVATACFDYAQLHDVVASLQARNASAENEVYYCHSDHLGSASWITDAAGAPVQHLRYLPFGQPLVNQHTTPYQERFTFTGKERDEETGYGYFGARYMDHDVLTMWLSVDPMCDKYPGISPYAYCAWNPIKFVDPDGRMVDEWRVNINTSEVTKVGNKGGGYRLLFIWDEYPRELDTRCK